MRAQCGEGLVRRAVATAPLATMVTVPCSFQLCQLNMFYIRETPFVTWFGWGSLALPVLRILFPRFLDMFCLRQLIHHSSILRRQFVVPYQPA